MALCCHAGPDRFVELPLSFAGNMDQADSVFFLISVYKLSARFIEIGLAFAT